MILTTGLVIAALILVNALYVAAEFGAVSVKRSRIRRLAEDGHPLAVRLLPVIADGRMLDQYIATCQVGITLSSLVLGAYGQATLAIALVPAFEGWGAMEELAAQSTAAAVVLIGLSALQVVLGELVPKSVALQYPTQAALYTLLPIRWSQRAFAWFTRILNGTALAALRLLGFSPTGHRHVHSPEEIELLIAESREGGLLEPEEHGRLHRALRLELRPARQLMVPRERIRALDVQTPVPRALELLADSPYTRLPVHRGSLDSVIGLLHTKDLVLRYIEGGGVRSLQEVVRPILTVPDHMAAAQLLALMRERRAHQALVLDAAGRLAGLITLEDVLAELLGEVSDEFKAHEEASDGGRDG
jgi:putative hemolysin